MSTTGKPAPTHPEAYRPGHRPATDWYKPLLMPALFIGFLLIWFRDAGLVTVSAVVLITLSAIWPLVRGRRRPPAVIVDEPGIVFGETGDGSGPRLVPWESITSVVLFETPRTDTTREQWEPALGVSLVGHPDGVSVYRPLTHGKIDRAALERAVRRFGGDVEVVDGARTAAGPNREQLQDEIRRTAHQALQEAGYPGGTEPGAPADPATTDPVTTDPVTTGAVTTGGIGLPGPPEQPARFQWHRTARYQPVDPDAYLARFTLRSNLPLVLILLALELFLWGLVFTGGGFGVLLAAVFCLVPLVLFGRTLRSGGAVALAVDRPGVFFGETTSPGDDHTHRLVPWSQISAVVVFPQLVDGSDTDQWRTAVGVRLRGHPNLVSHWRIVSGWTLDRPALESAVTRCSPGVRVLDGPPQRTDSTAVLRALLEVGRELADQERRRHEG